MRAVLAPVRSNLRPFSELAQAPLGTVSEARSSPQAVTPINSIGAKRINNGEMIFGCMCFPKTHWANSADIQWVIVLGVSQ